MADDLFSRLFELFNQPGPINWKLAGEVARHLAGEREAVDPWAADQVVDLAGLAQARLEVVAPFPIPTLPASLVDPSQWVTDHLQSFTYVAEAIAEVTAGAIPGMGAALAGMQVGTLVGNIARENVASFESGFPVDDANRVTLIGRGLDRVGAGRDHREVRLWAVASETAHLAQFRVPWLTEHLTRLLTSYAVHLVPDPEQIMEMWGGGDPASLAEKLSDPESLKQLSGGEEGLASRQALEAFFAVTGGYRVSLIARAFGNMLPALEELHTSPEPQLMGIPIADEAMVSRGRRFVEEVERRYGREAVDGIWLGPERLPTDAELDDPVGWAARVLLEEYPNI